MANITTYQATVETGYNDESLVWSKTITATNGDTIQAVNVRKGWQVVGLALSFQGTASSTLSIGDSGSATRYMNAVATATSNTLGPNVPTTITSNVIATGLGYRYLADDTLVLTLGGADVAAKTYTLIVKFNRRFD